MKVITCASYYGSGSSALTDLVAEYSNVKDLSNFEFRFLHDTDGVRDLEYHLVENHNRHNSGHALKRFAKLAHFNEGNFMSKRYSNFFDGNEYGDITAEYINDLTDFKCTGWWFYDLYDKGAKVYYLYQLVNHFFRRIPGQPFKILRNEQTLYSHPTEQEFLNYTKKYISNLLKALNKENKEYLEIDQILPSSNIEQVMKYFEDEIFVFVVDRDPRDIYLSEKYYWKEGVLPTDPEKFCDWFLYCRKAGKGSIEESSRIIKIQFEDLIYKYDETVARVEKAAGLKAELHDKQYTKMNPQRSIVNTRLWEKFPNDHGIKIIEEKLKDYLYDYSEIDIDNVKGIKTNESSIF